MDKDYWKNKSKQFEYTESRREHSHKVEALASETLPDSHENENDFDTEDVDGPLNVKKSVHRHGATANEKN